MSPRTFCTSEQCPPGHSALGQTVPSQGKMSPPPPPPTLHTRAQCPTYGITKETVINVQPGFFLGNNHNLHVWVLYNFVHKKSFSTIHPYTCIAYKPSYPECVYRMGIHASTLVLSNKNQVQFIRQHGFFDKTRVESYLFSPWTLNPSKVFTLFPPWTQDGYLGWVLVWVPD